MTSDQPERTDEEILAALERWLKRVENPDDTMIGFNMAPERKRAYTFREAVQEVRNKTEFGEKLVSRLKKIAETHDRDIIEFIDGSI